MRQVRFREIVQGALQHCLRQPFRRRYAQAARQVQRADPVQRASALESAVKSQVTGAVVVDVEGLDADEAGHEYLSEFAGHLEILITGGAQAQAEAGAQDTADGLAEFAGEIKSGVEAPGERAGVVVAGQRVTSG